MNGTAMRTPEDSEYPEGVGCITGYLPAAQILMQKQMKVSASCSMGGQAGVS